MISADRNGRRERLVTSANPDPRQDYVVTLTAAFTFGGSGADVEVQVRYVPDREIIEEDPFLGYMNALAAEPWSSLEEAATAILDDINNQVVARWVQVAVQTNSDSKSLREEHAVLLEDRQPNWDNEILLSRLRRL